MQVRSIPDRVIFMFQTVSDMDIAVASAAGCGLVSASLLYRAMRPKFPVTVNCHFCNIDTQVRYDERNSWTCEHCQQYNGFTTEGDYNRQVGVEEVRARFVKEQVRMEETDNGLCRGCNLNQQLKVRQIPDFYRIYLERPNL